MNSMMLVGVTHSLLIKNVANVKGKNHRMVIFEKHMEKVRKTVHQL